MEFSWVLSIIFIATSLPVGTCLASFTFAKFPFPIVLRSLYFPICSSAGRHLVWFVAPAGGSSPCLHRVWLLLTRTCILGEPWRFKVNIKLIVNTFDLCSGHASYDAMFSEILKGNMIYMITSIKCENFPFMRWSFYKNFCWWVRDQSCEVDSICVYMTRFWQRDFLRKLIAMLTVCISIGRLFQFRYFLRKVW